MYILELGKYFKNKIKKDGDLLQYLNQVFQNWESFKQLTEKLK